MPFALDVVDFTLARTARVPNPIIPVNPSTLVVIRHNPSSYDLQQAAQDDISNQNLSAIGNIGGSG